MTKMTYIKGGVAAVMLFGATAALAEWRLVGERQVLDRAETDTIRLAGSANYERVRFCVYRNPVHIIDVDIHFRNGGHQDVALAARLNAGTCSRAVDLEGGSRDIERIVMRYEETSRRRARATLRVFAE